MLGRIKNVESKLDGKERVARVEARRRYNNSDVGLKRAWVVANNPGKD